MKIFFTYQGDIEKIFFDLDVSESSTVAEFLDLPRVKSVLSKISHSITIGVNSEILDGVFKPLPKRYRLSEGQRVEIYKPLKQDPKERRRKKV
ncbi:RnfH family protein [Gammaproteobacteria bacterium]|jgi:putative ubiquitin-RnfH superfamily antitoxin RatB of RatAB toxin-antitoxin module|nr:RnfH family protein [Gammaproteobacteria bacterium]MDB9861668.1 RnfH family protein [Gammaproteobacteria bacterium]MDB9996809.1 RnfH family protein [Gammaproteobacteria bacterium]|tara:strand:+ start:384 stop:662 length:279 start_codon:yes stop_codon:yes gene_type:complete